ncbi:MAG: methyltransferase domain-containing protein [Candidatus Omnitrophica bacterium]|nr:methyltransferase domain-containing protein [Candidatus Omnitrophota bacterium]
MKRKRMFFGMNCLVLAVFIFMSTLSNFVCAQGMFVGRLPQPGQMVFLSPAFNPLVIKGIKLYPQEPLRFDFIIDVGDSSTQEAPLREASAKAIKYFLAALTVPEDDLWVNLSPFEKDRIIPDDFGVTEMGRDLLAQDYLLKQITASLMYPEEELGRKFWETVYRKAYDQYGTTDIFIGTFNKVWILPDHAEVFENGDSALIVDCRLRVLTEFDYKAEAEQREISTQDQSLKTDHLNKWGQRNSSLTSEIVREIIIPELEKEVNEGQNFADLRQIYHSLILATWLKQRLKNSVMSKLYINQNKTAGVNVDDPEIKEKIYQQYLAAYRKGVYNYIKEDYDPYIQDVVPRKYFSGGMDLAMLGQETNQILKIVKKLDWSKHAQRFTNLVMTGVILTVAGTSAADVGNVNLNAINPPAGIVQQGERFVAVSSNVHSDPYNVPAKWKSFVFAPPSGATLDLSGYRYLNVRVGAGAGNVIVELTDLLQAERQRLLEHKGVYDRKRALSPVYIVGQGEDFISIDLDEIKQSDPQIDLSKIIQVSVNAGEYFYFDKINSRDANLQLSGGLSLSSTPKIQSKAEDLNAFRQFYAAKQQEKEALNERYRTEPLVLPQGVLTGEAQSLLGGEFSDRIQALDNVSAIITDKKHPNYASAIKLLRYHMFNPFQNTNIRRHIHYLLKDRAQEQVDEYLLDDYVTHGYRVTEPVVVQVPYIKTTQTGTTYQYDGWDGQSEKARFTDKGTQYGVEGIITGPETVERVLDKKVLERLAHWSIIMNIDPMTITFPTIYTESLLGAHPELTYNIMTIHQQDIHSMLSDREKQLRQDLLAMFAEGSFDEKLDEIIITGLIIMQRGFNVFANSDADLSKRLQGYNGYGTYPWEPWKGTNMAKEPVIGRRAVKVGEFIKDGILKDISAAVAKELKIDLPLLPHNLQGVRIGISHVRQSPVVKNLVDEKKIDQAVDADMAMLSLPQYLNIGRYKWAMRKSGYKQAQDLIEAALNRGDLLGRTTDGLNKIMSIPGMPGYSLQVPELSEFEERLQTVQDPFPNRNFGQAIARYGNFFILKRQAGFVGGVPAWSEATFEEKDRVFEQYLDATATMPQTAYNDLAASIQTVDRSGFRFDPNPNNILVDRARDKFNIVDIKVKNLEHTASVAEMITALTALRYSEGPYSRGRAENAGLFKTIMRRSFLAAIDGNILYPPTDRYATSTLRSVFKQAGIENRWDEFQSAYARLYEREAAKDDWLELFNRVFGESIGSLVDQNVSPDISPYMLTRKPEGIVLADDKNLDEKFARYIERDQVLSQYAHLAQLFLQDTDEMRRIKAALLTNPHWRPVFMQALPSQATSEIIPLNRFDSIRDLGGMELLESHRVFSFGQSQVSLEFADARSRTYLEQQEAGMNDSDLVENEFKIIVGLADRYSEKTLDFYKVAHGRRVFFPLADGFFLSLKGIGQLVQREQSPYFYDQKTDSLRGLAIEAVLPQYLKSADLQDISLYPESLAYMYVYRVPNGQGALESFEAMTPQRSDLQQSLVYFEKTIHPDRLLKLSQMGDHDPDLQKIAWQISQNLIQSGHLSKDTLLTPRQLFSQIFENMFRRLALDQNAGISYAVVHAQDITFTGSFEDKEERQPINHLGGAAVLPVMERVVKEKNIFENFDSQMKIFLQVASYLGTERPGLVTDFDAFLKGALEIYFTTVNDGILSFWVRESSGEFSRALPGIARRFEDDPLPGLFNVSRVEQMEQRLKSMVMAEWVRRLDAMPEMVTDQEVMLTGGFTDLLEFDPQNISTVQMNGRTKVSSSLTPDALSQALRAPYYQVERNIQDNIILGRVTSPADLGWGFFNTSIRDFSESIDVDVMAGVLSYISKVRKDVAPDEEIVIVDWGTGEGNVLNDVAAELEARGMTNVRLIGFANVLSQQWGRAHSNVEFIFDDGRNFFHHFKDTKVDIMLSNMGLVHLQNDFVPFLFETRNLMKPGGIIIADSAVVAKDDTFEELFGLFFNLIKNERVSEGTTTLVLQKVIPADNTQQPSMPAIKEEPWLLNQFSDHGRLSFQDAQEQLRQFVASSLAGPYIAAFRNDSRVWADQKVVALLRELHGQGPDYMIQTPIQSYRKGDLTEQTGFDLLSLSTPERQEVFIDIIDQRLGVGPATLDRAMLHRQREDLRFHADTITNVLLEGHVKVSTTVIEEDMARVLRHPYYLMEHNEDTGEIKGRFTSPQYENYSFFETDIGTISHRFDVDVIEGVMSYIDMVRSNIGSEREIVILDWGAGEGEMLNHLAGLIEDEGIRNVKLIGFANIFSQDWARVHPNVEFIFDDAQNLFKHFKDRKIDMVFSHMGMTHVNPTAMADYLHGMGDIMQPGGLLVMDYSRRIHWRTIAKGILPATLQSLRNERVSWLDSVLVAQRVISDDAPQSENMKSLRKQPWLYHELSFEDIMSYAEAEAQISEYLKTPDSQPLQDVFKSILDSLTIDIAIGLIRELDGKDARYMFDTPEDSYAKSRLTDQRDMRSSQMNAPGAHELFALAVKERSEDSDHYLDLAMMPTDKAKIILRVRDFAREVDYLDELKDRFDFSQVDRSDVRLNKPDQLMRDLNAFIKRQARAHRQIYSMMQDMVIAEMEPFLYDRKDNPDGVTRAALGEELDIHPSSIYSIMNRKFVPSAELLGKLGNELGFSTVSISELRVRLRSLEMMMKDATRLQGLVLNLVRDMYGFRSFSQMSQAINDIRQTKGKSAINRGTMARMAGGTYRVSQDMLGSLSQDIGEYVAGQSLDEENVFVVRSQYSQLLKRWAVQDEIGKLIRRSRERQNIIQEDMANRLGISVPQYRGFETGMQPISQQYLDILYEELHAHENGLADRISAWKQEIEDQELIFIQAQEKASANLGPTRRSKNVSQEQLYQRTGISDAKIRLIENGSETMDPYQTFAFARGLSVTPARLWPEEDLIQVAFDQASLTRPDIATDNLGGIDFRPEQLNIETKGEVFDFEPNAIIGDVENFTGFTPIIMQITPITNLPLILGAKDVIQEDGLSSS